MPFYFINLLPTSLVHIYTTLQGGAWKLGVFCLSIIFFGLVKFVKFVVNSVAMLDVHSGGPGEERKCGG